MMAAMQYIFGMMWSIFLFFWTPFANFIGMFIAAPPTTIKIEGRERPLPPGTRMGIKIPIPLVGETMDFMMNFFQYLDDRTQRFGMIFSSNLFFRNTIFLTGPEAMKMFYDREHVSRSEGMPFFHHYVASGHLMNMREDNVHRERVEKAMKSIGAPDQVDFSLGVMSKKMDEFFHRWNSMKSFRWVEEIMQMMSEIDSITLFGKEGCETTLKPLSVGVMNGMTAIPMMSPAWWTSWFSSERAKRYIMDMAKERIRDDQAMKHSKDVLTMMTRYYQDGAFNTWEGMATEMNRFWMSSSVMMPNYMAGMMMLLSLHPSILQRARQEVRERAASGDLTAEKLDHLPFIKSIVDEVHRMCPSPAAMFGRVMKGFEMNGYWIPQDCCVVANFWGTNHDSKEYSDPMKFNPERFLNGEPKSGAMAFVPYGIAGASQMCPGMDRNHFMMRMFLVTMLRRCEWDVPMQSFDWKTMLFNPKAADHFYVKNFRITQPQSF